MRIGTPKELKVREQRVGLTPDGARELTLQGHEVFIETSAGAGVGFADKDYVAAGCQIVPDADALFEKAELIVKVKEPQAEEIVRLRPQHTLFTYLHLAPDPQQAKGLMASGATCIAYETVIDSNGRLPLLTPMSEVAGRLSVQAGAHYLESLTNNRGVLLGGVTGVAPAKVVIIGGGVSGRNAAQMAIGLGADVTIFDKSLERLRELEDVFRGRARLQYSTVSALDEALSLADLVVGAVLVPGAAAPRIVSKDQVRAMRPGTVMVDIAIDQGGCFETSHATTHEEPVYEVDGVVHYCVTNMPAAVARTATQALTNATLPYVQALAAKGTRQAMDALPGLAAGLNVVAGEIVHEEVVRALGSQVD